MSRFESICRACLLIVAVMGLAAPAAAQPAETVANPIWLAPALEIKSLAEIDARLTRPLDIDERLQLQRSGAKAGRQDVKNCLSLASLTADGYRPDVGVDTYIYSIQKTTCEAVSMVRSMRPARQSFVRNFVLNEAALRFLPARIDLNVACGTDGRLPGGEFSLMSWQEYTNGQNGGVGALGKLAVVVRNDFEVTVKSAISEITFEILARGDIDDDGFEDLVIRVSRDLSSSAPGAAAIYVVTREAPDAVMRLVDDRCGPRFPTSPVARPR